MTLFIKLTATTVQMTSLLFEVFSIDDLTALVLGIANVAFQDILRLNVTLPLFVNQITLILLS